MITPLVDPLRDIHSISINSILHISGFIIKSTEPTCICPGPTPLISPWTPTLTLFYTIHSTVCLAGVAADTAVDYNRSEATIESCSPHHRSWTLASNRWGRGAAVIKTRDLVHYHLSPSRSPSQPFTIRHQQLLCGWQDYEYGGVGPTCIHMTAYRVNL